MNTKQFKNDLKEELKRRMEQRLIDFYEPLPQQLPFHNSEAQTRSWSCGNRSGKTAAGAVESVWFATGSHPYRTDVPPEGGNVWLVTQTREQAREAVLTEVIKWLPKTVFDPEKNIGRIVYTRNDIPDFIEIKHTYKGKIYRNKLVFKSQEMGYRAFQSAEKLLIWFDEDINDQRLFAQARARFGKYKVCIIVTATPLSMKSIWFDDWIKLKAVKEPKRYWYSTHGSYQGNTFNSASEREHFAGDIEGFVQAETMLTGKRVPPGGLVFPHFDKEVYLLPETPCNEYLKTCTIYRGIDWAGANGVFGCLWVAVDKGGYKTIFREYEGTAGYNTHIKNIVSRSYIGSEKMNIRWTICDWATIGSYNSGFNIRREFAIGGEFRNRPDGNDYRIPTILAKKGAGSVESSIEAMTSALLMRDSDKHTILRISPECPTIIDQIEKYSRHEINSLDDKSRVIKRKDHLIDCWKYMEMMGMRYVNPSLLVSHEPNNISTITGLRKF